MLLFSTGLAAYCMCNLLLPQEREDDDDDVDDDDDGCMSTVAEDSVDAIDVAMVMRMKPASKSCSQTKNHAH